MRADNASMVIAALIRVALVIARDRSKSTCGKRSILLRIVHVVDQILHHLAAASMGERHRRHVDLAWGPGADARSDVHSAAS